MNNDAYLRKFWAEKIDWNRIKKELPQYPNINKVFSLDKLKEVSNRGPYFCHPLARWFGYLDKSKLNVLNQLLEKLKDVEGIDKKLELLITDYDSTRFWSMRAELSVASFFLDKVEKINLIEEGKQPDIQFESQGKNFYVEVCDFHKFHYRLFELEEILGNILKDTGPQAYLRWDAYLSRKNVNDGELSGIARECLEKVHDVDFKNQFQQNHLTKIFERDSLNLCVYVQNDLNDNQYDSSHISMRYGYGDYNLYMREMIGEIIERKNDQLADKHSNYLAVNILFNTDIQMLNWNQVELQDINFGNIDNIVFFTNSISDTTICIEKTIPEKDFFKDNIFRNC